MYVTQKYSRSKSVSSFRGDKTQVQESNGSSRCDRSLWLPRPKDEMVRIRIKPRSDYRESDATSD